MYIYSFKDILYYGIESCFLNYQNQIYIAIGETSSYGPINVFDLKGNKGKKIHAIPQYLKYIENYYDLQINKNFIISCDIYNIVLYDYNEDSTYHKFKEHCYNFSILNNKETVKLIAMGIGSIIMIWNIHSKELLKKIKINNISTFCVWNNNYIIMSDYLNNMIYAMNIDDEKKKKIISHSNSIVNIQKIIHPLFGECLLSQDKNGIIKISY